MCRKLANYLVSLFRMQYFRHCCEFSFHEIYLQDCRVNVGNGLQILDVLKQQESVSFYFFIVPKYIDRETRQPKPKPKSMARWDFLIEYFREVFDITEDFHCETTFTK